MVNKSSGIGSAARYAQTSSNCTAAGFSVLIRSRLISHSVAIVSVREVTWPRAYSAAARLRSRSRYSWPGIWARSM
jgi:hypothetical protein